MEDKEVKNILKNIDPDVAHQLYHSGFNSGVEHRTPSPQTLTELKNLSEKLDGNRGNTDKKLNNLRDEVNMQHDKTNDKIDNIKDSISELKVLLTGMPERIFEKSDERYASKEDIENTKLDVSKLSATVTKVLWAVATAITGFTIEIVREIIMKK